MMRPDPRVDVLRALGDPVRLRVIDHLFNVRSATVSELAARLDVSITTLSNHLRKLREANLIVASPSGRHVMYALADPGLETLLPLLDRITGRLAAGPAAAPDTPRAAAATCYDHLAGGLGVDLFARLIELDAIRERPDGSVELGANRRAFDALGVEVPRPGRRRFAYECLDAIHHRPHLGGALGAALLRALTDRAWLVPGHDRVVSPTPAGRRGLERAIGLKLRVAG